MYPQVFGKYVLERELSRGGMARVVLATLRGAGGFEKRLVVKQIRDELAFDQQFVRRFVEEAKTTVALSHPNIVPVYELGVEQGTYFLAMELVEGVSIAELVRERDAEGKKRVLTPEEGAYVGMEVCRALDYAHRRMKVVHRDITPRNVMLDEEGQVKLIDFGIAAPARVAGHEILGSPGHMPPEQVEGKELGPSTDIFAVAALLMEAWTGTAPFRRATPEECDAAMREEHPRPSDFDGRLAPLDEAIGRAMKLEPKDRQQQAGELGRALRAFLKGKDPSDIAHVLGERVRTLRETLEDVAPASGLSAPRAPAPSVVEFGTRTFAARDEAPVVPFPPASYRELGGEPEEAAGEGTQDAPRTRKLEGGAPLPDAPPPLRAGTARAKTAKDPVLSVPTPLMIQTGVTLEAVRDAAREASAKAALAAKRDGEGDAPRSDRIETIATRPLETPVRRDSTSAPAARRPSEKADDAEGKARPWLVPAALAAFLIVGVAGWRAKVGGDGPAKPGGVTTTATATAAPTPLPTPTLPSSATPTADPSVASAPGVPSATPSGAATGPAVASGAVQVVATGKAQVTFLGDPGTRVSVDGTSRGACPSRLALDPGTHDVRFFFDPTGESRGERLTVKGGERVTVRADFTGATPTVRVQR